MTWRARVELSRSALQHNHAVAQQISGCKTLSVIKADAYGHGMLEVAEALQAYTDGFAVACLDEALALRRRCATLPILVLQGLYTHEFSRLPDAIGAQLWLVVHNADLYKHLLTHLPDDAELVVWLKVNTGMNRLGVDAESLAEYVARLRQHPGVRDVVLMSHLASADEHNSLLTKRQIRHFSGLTFHGSRSLANSAGIMAWSPRIDLSHDAWARPGIMLYGISPFGIRALQADKLQAVMRLVARVMDVRPVPNGASVGYGEQWRANSHSHIAHVSIGYGDGYPRYFAQTPSVTLIANDGQHWSCPLAGRVSMDMLAIELPAKLVEQYAASDLIGAEVELWGPHNPIETVAACANTIAYELTCRLTPRLPRVWL